jgi:hypothetical protein
MDVAAAQIMIADLPFVPHVYSREEVNAAEARLAELLAEVRKGDKEPLDKRHPPSPLDVADVVDCSDVKASEVGGGGTLGYIHNYAYSWKVIPRENGKSCVYLRAPFERGLSAADGADFTMAQRLRLIPRPPDAPNLERTIAIALERFGGGGGSTTESLPTDLVDCTDFERGPVEDASQDESYGGYVWMADGWYTFNYYHSAKGTCLFVQNEEDSRGLKASEGRAMIRAARAGIDDPAHAAEQRIQNCFAKVLQNYAANVPTYEEGTINGRRYRVFYPALDPDLRRLDEAAHAFVASRKELWKQKAPALARIAGQRFDVEIRFRTLGRTRALATLEGWQATPGAAETTDAKKEWWLHVPSGRFLTFEDLFVEPEVVHEQIAARYLAELPQQLESFMASMVFIGDDAAQQEKDFRASYLSDARRIAETPVAHFADVGIGPTGEHAPFFTGAFTRELLPDETTARWSAQLKDLASELKPEFRNVLHGDVCRPVE